MTAEEAEDFGATQGRWNALVRRARLNDLKRKVAALVVGSYADGDGTNVKCGVARLAADCEMGYSTARRYLAWLREVGLIELVYTGSRKAKRADVYRLTIKPHTEKALSALTEDEYRALVDGMKSTNRDGEKGRRLRSPIEVSADSPEPGGDEFSSALTQGVSADSRDTEDPFCAHPRGERRSVYLRSPIGEPPPKEQRSPPTGDAPSPDPWRRPPPSASATSQQKSPSEPLTPAQDQQRKSLPRMRAASAPGQQPGQLVDFFTREAM